MARTLLAIRELGGYPDFSQFYREAGYVVYTANGLRKGLVEIKRLKPEAVVTEFRYKPTYGTQISNLESLFAALQKHAPQARLIVFYDKPDHAQLLELEGRFANMSTLAFPILAEKLINALHR